MNLAALSSIRRLIIFALPICASSLTNMAINFFAMFFVAKLGTHPLAAGALAISTFITISMVLPIFYALSILISHQRGSNAPLSETGKIVKNGFWLALFLSIPTGILLWNAPHLLSFFKQDPELVLLTVPYFHYTPFALFTSLMANVVLQFYIGIGYPRFGFYVSLCSMPVSLIVAYSLVLGHWGSPQMGLAGVSCTTALVQTLFCTLIILYLFLSPQNKEYAIFSGGFWPDFGLCKKIFSLGSPIGIQFAGELAAMTSATYLMGYLGVFPLAASQITTQYSMLVVMIILGISQALSVLTSEAFGKKDIAQIREYLRAAIIVLLGFFVFIFIAFFGFSHYLAHFFIKPGAIGESSIYYFTHIFFMLTAFTMLADGFRNVFSSGLRGLHDSKAPMKIGILCLWLIALPASYLIGFIFSGGPIGLRVGFMTGFIVGAILLGNRYYKKIEALETTN